MIHWDFNRFDFPKSDEKSSQHLIADMIIEIPLNFENMDLKNP